MQAKLILAVLPAGLLAAAPAAAMPQRHESVRIIAKSGRNAYVRRYATLGEDCKWDGGPAITVTRPPAHGKLATRPGSYQLKGAILGDDGHCVGREITGRFLYYTPEKSYRGSDRFEYDVVLPGGTKHCAVRVKVE